ncbi:hypothetical protein [Geodermatophilus sp. SYSU D00815]
MAARLLLAFLVVVIAVELVAVIGVAVSLFLLGATETIVFGVGMLVVSAVACGPVLRSAWRERRRADR